MTYEYRDWLETGEVGKQYNITSFPRTRESTLGYGKAREQAWKNDQRFVYYPASAMEGSVF